MLKSADGGITFAHCDSTLPAGAILAIALDGNTVYAALPTGVFKSVDGCLTFQVSDLSFHPDQIAIDPNRRSTVFAAAGLNLYRSDDSGATWQKQPLPRRNVVFDPAHPGVVYASDASTNYRSADRGVTWTALASFPSVAARAGALGVDSQGNLYGDDGRELYVSTDGGVSWTPRQTFGGTRLLTADATTMYAVAGDGIFASTDGFASYRTVEYFQVASITSLAVAGGAIFTGSTTQTSDAFVVKLDAGGNLVWGTYLGGPYDEYASAITVAPNGDVLVCGNQTGTLSFLARFTNNGDLIYSKRVTDGYSFPLGIATDAAGNAYIAGTTQAMVLRSDGTLPVTPGAAQTTMIPSSGRAPEPALPIAFPQYQDAFACKLDPDGAIIYCTYLGDGFNTGTTISVDSDGNAYVAGGATAWKLNASGSAILFTRTLTGGAITAGALDGTGSWLLGGTTSIQDFPTTVGAYQRVLNTPPALPIAGVMNGNTAGDGFVTRLDAATGEILASTLLGAEAADTVTAIAAGPDVTVTGTTQSRTFPLRAAFQSAFADNTAFLTRLTPDLSTLVFSTYAGDTRRFGAFGVVLADDGSVWIAGDTAYPWGAGAFAGGALPTAQIFVTQLIPQPAAPPDLTAVLNSASLRGTSIAPNQIITVMAPGAGGDTAVLIDGVALSTISSSSGVILAQVPAGFQPPRSVNLSVRSGGAASAPLLMPGAAAAPAIHTQDGSGTGLGIIFNEDGTLNTTANPAGAGSVVSIACNGIGPDTPVIAYIDGGAATVLEASSQAIPGVPGTVVVLRMRVPLKSTPLSAVTLSVDGILSQPYVAIAISGG